MGTEKVSYPFSWGQRGFPLRVSKEVEFCFTGEERADKASYISLEELRIKRVELLVINEEICPRLSNDLEHLIDAFPESDREAKYRRMVFWFH